MPESGDGLHFSYFFLPFRYIGDDYDTFRYRIDAQCWNIKPYILRDDRNRTALTDEDCRFSGWGSGFYSYVNDFISQHSCYYTLREEKLAELQDTVSSDADGTLHELPYRIDGVSLVHFDTGVGMVIYRAGLTENADEDAVAQMCFYLKQPGHVYIGAQAENRSIVSVLGSFFGRDTLTRMKFLFEYTDMAKGRVNFLSFSYSAGKPGHFTTDARQLQRMYLARYGYDKGCTHPVGYEYDDYAEILVLVDYINWGMTPEGAACLAYGYEDENGTGHREYLAGQFKNEFCSGYLFMYILLLHQRLALCAYQKDFAGAPDRAELHRFRAGYNIREISENVSCQRFYEKIYRQFAIDTLLKETEDRLPTVDDAGMKKLEAAAGRTNAMLAVILSVGTFSALADMLAFFGYMNGSSRKYLWLVVLFSMLILSAVTLTVTYMRKSFMKIFEEIRDDRGTHRILAIIAVIFAILLIFVAKWSFFK